MAVIGGNAGYATVDPLAQNQVGAAMSQVDDLALKNRALMEERLQKQAAERLARQKMRQDQLEKDKAELDKTKVDFTPYSTINGPLFEGVSALKKQYNEASQALADYSLSGAEANKYRDIMSHSLETLNKLGQNSKMLNDNLKNFKDHAGDYDQDSYNEYLRRLENLQNGQYKLDLSKGAQNITMPGADGSETTMSFEDFVNGKHVYRKVDIDKGYKDIQDSIELNERGTAGGGFQTNTELWTPDKIKSLQDAVGGMVDTEEKRYALSKRHNLPMDNVEALKQAAFDEIKSKIKTKKVTTGSDLEERKFARQKSKEDEENKPVDINVSEAIFQDEFNRTGPKGEKYKVDVDLDVYGNGYSFPKNIDIPNLKGKKGQNGVKIENVFIGKNGKVYVTGTALIDKKGTTTVTKKGVEKGDDDPETNISNTITDGEKRGRVTYAAGPTIMGKLAKSLGVKSDKEVKYLLYEKNGVPEEDRIYDAKSVDKKPVATVSKKEDLRNKYKY